MKHRFFATILAGLLLIAGAHGEPKVAEGVTALDDKIPLKVEDMVKAQIVEAKDAGLQHKVREDGLLRVPLIGEQKAAGLTAKALAAALKTTLENGYFKTATVRVERITDPKAEETQIFTFTIRGDVMKQGVYNVDPGEDLTVCQALLRAGGSTSQRKVILIRKSPEGETRIKINVDEVMKRGKLEKDVRIQPGDVIEIPEAVFHF